MPKIKVFIKLENKLNKEVLEKTYLGYKRDDKIIYQDEKTIVTIYKKSNTIEMIRKEEDFVTQLLFKKHSIQKGKIKTEEKILEFDVETSILEFTEKYLHICYKTKIEEVMGNFEFHLEVIE